MVTPKGPGRELGNGGFSYPRAELVVSLVDRMQLLPLSWEMARGATMQVHHGGPGGPSIHWKALSLLLQVTGGKTEPPPTAGRHSLQAPQGTLHSEEASVLQ